jgi:hypothetical protein
MNPATTFVNKIRDGAKKDPKKAGVLLVLVAVIGGMWVKVMLRPTPGSAQGAPVGGGTAAAATTTTDASSGSLTLAAAAGGTSDKRANRAGARAAWRQVPVAPASRNLFEVDYEAYPKLVKGPNNGGAGDLAQAGSEAAKSGPSPADVKKEKLAELIKSVRDQAGQLKLQTIVMGASPKALINGQLVGEGDVVASFRVVRITPRGMVIEREGIKLEIAMKS